MWRAACAALRAPAADTAWKQIIDSSPSDTVWHSLRNCIAYQAGVWNNLLQRGIDDVQQPAAFKLAIVLRHTPSEVTVKLLADILRNHPQCQELTSYVLALLTDDEPSWCGACDGGGADGDCSGTDSSASTGRDSTEPGSAGDSGAETDNYVPRTRDVGRGRSAAPRRDLQLFGDCELAVLAARREEYDAHAKLVRAEYAKLTHDNYVELRIKILNQFTKIPKLYHTTEFECFEVAARENIEREICTLREHLITGGKD